MVSRVNQPVILLWYWDRFLVCHIMLECRLLEIFICVNMHTFILPTKLLYYLFISKNIQCLKKKELSAREFYKFV